MASRCIRCMGMSESAVCSHCGYPEAGQNAAHQLPVGTVLRERYQIGRVLGQGGFGITYLAWDLLMEQAVAVKEFFPGGVVFRRSSASTTVECVTEEAVPHYDYSKERFLREAQALVKFKDIPEVVNILDFMNENNTTYIVMEYVRGVDLAKYIQRKGGRLTVEETFRILKPVMEALAKVHRGGIIHRDISPDNIILDPVGGAKLLDFGAVRAVENPDVDKGLSKSTEAILKQGFAPLEQYNSRGSLGPWTDEYAMCATVWYCLTGRVPAEASIRITEGIDPDWSTIPGLPEHQRKALEKGFSSRAKDRYPDMDALLAALFPVAEKAAPVEAPTPPPAPKKEEKPKKQPARKNPKGKKKPLVFVAAAAVVLILIAAVVLIPGKQEGDSPAQLQDAPGMLPTEAPGQTEPAAPETVPTTEATEPPTEPLSPEEQSYLLAEQLLAEGKLGEAAIAFGKLAGYSDARERSLEIWDKIAERATVSAGGTHTLGLRTDGTAVAVGLNHAGQCDVSEWSNIVAVSTSTEQHTVGLRADGTVVVVSNNEYGDVSSWTDIVAVSAGGWHTVGLRADGTVVAVGNNEYGQCDVSEWADIVAVSAGYNYTVGLRAGGTVVAVGVNDYGQCNVSGWSDIVAVSASNHHTVGLRADGTVVAVGENDCGQCNVSSWSDIVAVSSGHSHTVGLRADGTVVAVGWNGKGQCDMSGWTDIVAVSAGHNHTVGLRADGTVVAVGENKYGQCNVGDWTDIRIPQRVSWFKQENDPSETTPPGEEDSASAEAYANAEKLLAEGKLGEAAIAFGKLAGYSDARERSIEIWDKIAVRDTVSAGWLHSLGLKTDGTVVAAGSNYVGDYIVEDWTDIVAISAGLYSCLGLRTDGTVVTAGDTSNGRDDVQSWTDIVAIDAGGWHTVGLKTDGTVVAVGRNNYGQCDVQGWTDIVAIGAGESYTVGLKADGTVVAVGENDSGQCDVDDWSDIVAIDAVGWHTVGLKADGTVVAVGENDSGQCDVDDWSDIVAIGAGGWHTVGLKADGTVVAVGVNIHHGQCNVEGWSDIVAIGAGGYHTLGLRSDGTVVAVGSNEYGQCGMAHWAPWTDIRIPNKPVPFR